MKLRLWRCEYLTPGTEIPCNRGVYTDLDAPPPNCEFEPDYGPGHGAEFMVDEGVYDFEGAS